jgi:carbamoyl-phosphate synthase small subunit
MSKRAILALEDGSVFEGYSFGADTETFGEVVFNTSMIGYQEILTDPSYAGQIVLPTYPLIGNYGINELDSESRKIQVRGFVVREECLEPSHYLSGSTIHDFLLKAGIPAIYGLDTRSITRKLRSCGVMMGMISTTRTPASALEELHNLPGYGDIDFVKQVSTDEPYQWGPPCDSCSFKMRCEKRAPGSPLVCGRTSIKNDDKGLFRIATLDCGLKFNILRLLGARDCSVTVMPCATSAKDIMSLKPDGLLLSPGPGNPDILDYAVDTIREIAPRKPTMGICLGNQLIARAFGGSNFKLKFGHRGGNHPVRELETGRTHITAQNHGYAVEAASLGSELEVTHINLNDNTVEGLRHKWLPIFAIQYHSEASPGPWDSEYLFDKFVQNIRDTK